MPAKAIYAARKAAGRCPVCNQPHPGRFVKCDTCRSTYVAAEHEKIFQRTGSWQVVPESRIREIEAHMEVHLEGRLVKIAALMKKLASDLEQSDLPDVDAEIVQDLRIQWERLNANFEETEEPDVQEKENEAGQAREN